MANEKQISKLIIDFQIMNMKGTPDFNNQMIKQVWFTYLKDCDENTFQELFFWIATNFTFFPSISEITTGYYMKEMMDCAIRCHFEVISVMAANKGATHSIDEITNDTILRVMPFIKEPLRTERVVEGDLTTYKRAEFISCWIDEYKRLKSFGTSRIGELFTTLPRTLVYPINFSERKRLGDRVGIKIIDDIVKPKSKEKFNLPTHSGKFELHPWEFEKIQLGYDKIAELDEFDRKFEKDFEGRKEEGEKLRHAIIVKHMNIHNAAYNRVMRLSRM